MVLRSTVPVFRAFSSARPESESERMARLKKPILWGACVVVGAFGLTYLAVPMYKLFCATTGDVLKQQEESVARLKEMRPPDREARVMTVTFQAATNDRLQWSFRPCQNQIKVIPGKSSLAFYNARNKADRPIIGMATYNVTPIAAGKYFNKIQCFCFEEQRLAVDEDVDMPVFFYLDPDLYDDPQMNGVRHITLSYTFFEASDSENIEASLAAGNQMGMKTKYQPRPAQSPYTGEPAKLEAAKA